MWSSITIQSGLFLVQSIFRTTSIITQSLKEYANNNNFIDLLKPQETSTQLKKSGEFSQFCEPSFGEIERRLLPPFTQSGLVLRYKTVLLRWVMIYYPFYQSNPLHSHDNLSPSSVFFFSSPHSFLFTRVNPNSIFE